MKKKIGFGILVVLALIGLISIIWEIAVPNALYYAGWREVEKTGFGACALCPGLAEVEMLDGSKVEVEYVYHPSYSSSRWVGCDFRFKDYYYTEFDRIPVIRYFEVEDRGSDGIIDHIHYITLRRMNLWGKDWVQIKDGIGHYMGFKIMWRDYAVTDYSEKIFAEAQNVYNQLPMEAVIK